MLSVLIWFSASDKTCCLRRPITLAGTTPARIARRSGIAGGSANKPSERNDRRQRWEDGHQSKESHDTGGREQPVSSIERRTHKPMSAQAEESKGSNPAARPPPRQGYPPQLPVKREATVVASVHWRRAQVLILSLNSSRRAATSTDIL